MLIHFTLSPESNIIKVQAGFLTQLSLYCLPILNEQWLGVTRFLKELHSSGYCSGF